MSLEYRVLWIDDALDWVVPVREAIEEKIKDLSLAPSITVRENGDDLMGFMSVESVDLLVIDYHLPGKNGDDLIKIIREHGELTEIVFYSQDNAHRDSLSGWDGVHYTLRDDAEDKIKEVIEWFAKRNENISVMRGVIIAEAIDVENKLTEIIKKLFADKSELFQTKILDKPILDFEKKRMFVQSCLKDKIGEVKKNRPQDLECITKLEELRQVLQDLKAEIIDQRNILAHSDKTINKDGVLVLNNLHDPSKKIIFNNKWKNEVRTNMKKHRANLQKLYDLF